MDNGSVYSKNLVDFLYSEKIEFKSHPYNKLQESDIVKYDSFILSGRRINVQRMNLLNSKIIKHAINKKKPLLGICYGAEILALTVGGTIKKMNSPQRGIQEIIVKKQNPLCSGTLQVFQSHQYCISRINENISNLAESENCTYEIIQYGDLNIFGTQFHPEMNHDGKEMIKSFLTNR